MKKLTRWLSNSPRVLHALSRRCTGRGGACSRPEGGRHRPVEDALARASQVYPFALCKATLMGCRRQLIDDGRTEAVDNLKFLENLTPPCELLAAAVGVGIGPSLAVAPALAPIRSSRWRPAPARRRRARFAKGHPP